MDATKEETKVTKTEVKSTIDPKKQYSEYLIIAYLTYMSLYIIFNSAAEFLYKANPVYRFGNYIGLVLAIGTLVPLVRKVPTDFLIKPLKVNKTRIFDAFTRGLTICIIFGSLRFQLKNESI